MASGLIPRMKLGSQGLQVSAQGLGCRGMSAFYGPPKPESDMIRLIHHAIQSGITFLDTSDIYGPYTNEILLSKALKDGVREKVELATKFGVKIIYGQPREINSEPEYVRAACEASLKRLEDAAMGLVLSAANVGGWTTGSVMEGPSVHADSGTNKVSTFPWSLFTKSPRRRMRVAFTCNVCGQRTTRAINPHTYTDGTVFVQCCGCNVFHKLVDNLNLFHEMKFYVNPSFNYRDPNGDEPIEASA